MRYPCAAGPARLLRNFRAFRVFRLFKRVESLNKIIVSLGRAVPGVLNAFLVMTIVMCIYAILGVEFFNDFGEHCVSVPSSNESDALALVGLGGEEYRVLETSRVGNVTRICRAMYTNEEGYYISSHTLRGYSFGDEYYGNFLKSLFTLFQERFPGERFPWSASLASARGRAPRAVARWQRVAAA